jgi:prepilin-type N-terminal cleavage/methylation domain-containing protein/prepilin-type processing-associated H-X9-DG protein
MQSARAGGFPCRKRPLSELVQFDSGPFISSIPHQPVSKAFTLIELLVVIAILGILASMLLPVLSRGKSKAQGVSCVNNGKQMMTAMIMYTDDNHDFFPPNPDGGNIVPGHNWCSGQAGVGGAAEFNPDILSDPTLSLLTTYLSGNVSVFHCPTDLRTGMYQGSNPQWIGKIVPAARTFSMNNAVGTICPGFDAGTGHSGAPTLSVNGPWLNNQYDHRRDSPWQTYGKLSSVRTPGPSMLWVLLDEDIKDLNDAAFCFGMAQPIWYDVPGTYHDFGCGFAFADGHSEVHPWAYRAEKHGWGYVITDPQDLRDWNWMRERTSTYVGGAMPAPSP